jgi:hypothetical protein
MRGGEGLNLKNLYYKSKVRTGFKEGLIFIKGGEGKNQLRK